MKGLGLGLVPDERGVRVEYMKGDDVSKTTEQQTFPTIVVVAVDPYSLRQRPIQRLHSVVVLYRQ